MIFHIPFYLYFSLRLIFFLISSNVCLSTYMNALEKCILQLSLFIVVIVESQKIIRAVRASRTQISQINQLINEEIQRKLLQSDFPLNLNLNDAPTNEFVSHINGTAEAPNDVIIHHDELLVNDPNDYFHGDIELTAWQASQIRRQLKNQADMETSESYNNISKSETIELGKTNDELRIGDDGEQLNRNQHRRAKRKVGRVIYKRWEKRRLINYDFANSIPEPTREIIRQAINVWQKNTCLSFREGGSDVDRLEFYDGGGCSSFVGRVGGTQGISISHGCNYVGIVAHEIGHALGIFHEQARPDQQSHIAIHYKNIPISRWNNFYPIADSHATTYNLPYDAGSIMHYGAYSFASDPYKPTITTFDRGLQSTIGQRVEPSFLDVQSINEAYSCYEHCNSNRIVCAHGGYPNPRDCSQCVCPRGFGGKYCRHVEYSPCGGIVEVSEHPIYINSPNYPNNFPSNLTCIWLLRVDKNIVSMRDRKIFFEFVDNIHYNCETSETCDNSYVELKLGPDFRTTGYRLCCAVLPKQRFISNGDEMIVIHAVGNGPATSGYRARVWAYNKENSTKTTTRPEILPKTFTIKKPERVFPFTSKKSTSTFTRSSTSTFTKSSTSMNTITGSASTNIITNTASALMTITESTTASKTTTGDNLSPLPGEYSKSTLEFHTTQRIAMTTTSNNITPLPKPLITFLPLWTPLPAFTSPSVMPIFATIFPSNFLTTTTEKSVDKQGPTGSTIGRPPQIKCETACSLWSQWTECSQKCGGCGRRQRKRLCPLEYAQDCPAEEKRICAFDACPAGTNFLINNGEFHILWKSCCVGMFKRVTTSRNGTPASYTEECSTLESGENAFLQIINSLLSAHDSKAAQRSRAKNFTLQRNFTTDD